MCKKKHMEKYILSAENYSVYEATEECLAELSEFVVTENFKHHSSDYSCVNYEREIREVLAEERGYRDHSRIFLARDNKGNLVGSIRVFKWDRKEKLPIEKIFNICPLNSIGNHPSYSFWHIGRLAVSSDASIPSIHLFKHLMALAIEPVAHDTNAFMIAEIDSKLLRVMNALGFQTVALGAPINYLASDTVPVYSTRAGLLDFYNRYREMKPAS